MTIKDYEMRFDTLIKLGFISHLYESKYINSDLNINISVIDIINMSEAAWKKYIKTIKNYQKYDTK